MARFDPAWVLPPAVVVLAVGGFVGYHEWASSITPTKMPYVVASGGRASLLASGFRHGSSACTWSPAHWSSDTATAGASPTGFDADPTGGQLVLQPGSNSTTCRPVTVNLSQAQTRQIVNVLRGAGPAPSGPMSCPMDDGSTIALFADYSDGTVEFAQRGLCGFWSAPGQGAISDQEATEPLLARLTPAGFGP